MSEFLFIFVNYLKFSESLLAFGTIFRVIGVCYNKLRRVLGKISE
jgi:hypothetical protein